VDLAVTGFDADELADLFGPIDEGMLDTEPALPPAVPYTQRGDLWLLGPHRLLCGDATEQAAWDTVLAGRYLDCLWTDPPYGVSYVGGTKDALTITNDDLTPADLERLLRLAFACALAHSASGAPWYVTGPSGPTAIAFGHVLRDLEVWHQTLAWVKDRFVIGRSDYQPRHEQIFYGWTPGGRHVWLGGRRRDSILGEEDGQPVIVEEEGRILVKIGQTTFAITGVELAVQEVETSVIEAERPRRSREHPTMKPPRLIARCLLNSTRRGNLVGDSFAGSGSTVVAAEATGREAACLEIDPRYCDVIVNRYLTATGGEAVNERTGETIRSRIEVAA
jgi:DNA modification methylase